MDVITLEAHPRDVGKKGARAARRAGNVPCVLYGSHVDPVVFQVPERSLKPLIYTNETHLVKIDLDGNSWECVVKDLDFHPVTDRPLHADFQVLRKGEKITLTVPVRYLGTPVGQTEGGRPNYLINELDVSCLPQDIPSYIDVDVSALHIGDSLHISELELESVEILAPADLTLVMVERARVVVEPTEVEEVLEVEAGEAEEAGEEGEADEAA